MSVKRNVQFRLSREKIGKVVPLLRCINWTLIVKWFTLMVLCASLVSYGDSPHGFAQTFLKRMMIRANDTKPVVEYAVHRSPLAWKRPTIPYLQSSASFTLLFSQEIVCLKQQGTLYLNNPEAKECPTIHRIYST